jgi:endonuclease-8
MEGPSLVILAEEAKKFVGNSVTQTAGSTKLIDIKSFRGRKLTRIRTWGKHFLLCFDRDVIKIHFLMFGSYRIDEDKPGALPRLCLRFPNGRMNFYSCSIRLLEKPVSQTYDWRVDLMSRAWDERLVLRLLANQGNTELCDLLLDQNIFAGSGNIIKNEVLFRLGLHPERKLESLSPAARRSLVGEMRRYSKQFYRWKKKFVLRKHWQIYRAKLCPNCQTKVVLKKTGELHRRSFLCPLCQPLHVERRKASSRCSPE